MPARTHSRPRGPSERGAALLTAIVAVAVLTAVAVDLAYQCRVSLQIAANARDELRGEYLARSGVAMSRLLLSFQQQLDGATSGSAGAALGSAPGATTGSGATGATGATGGAGAAGGGLAGLAGLLGGGGIPRIQLWNIVPIDRSFVDGLFAGAPAATSPSLFATQERKPEASGPTFDAVIEDEARKVNAQFFGFTQGTDVTLRQRVQSLYQLVCAARFDPLFDREDANGVRSTREDLLVRLRDWVDEGDVTSALAAGPGSTSAQCGLVVGQPPFVDAFGDENQLYDRGDVRYKTKNAQLDSLDELHLVYGIGDTFMGAFGDSLTVYLKSGDKQNVNDLDKDRLVSRAFMLANPKNQPALFDPELGNKLLKAMRELTFGGLLSMSPKQFGVLVATTGITIDQSLLADNGPFTDRSKVFRIRATGKAGAVRSTIDTVVRFEDTKVPGEQIAAPGRIIHWRED